MTIHKHIAQLPDIILDTVLREVPAKPQEASHEAQGQGGSLRPALFSSLVGGLFVGGWDATEAQAIFIIKISF